jgi:hypothetical protein
MKALRWTMPKAAEPLKPNQRYLKFYRFPRCGPDEVLGSIVMRVASFLPFQTSDYLNGHSFIEQELKRARIGFRKTDNAFLAVDDVVLQAAADKQSGHHRQPAQLLDPDPRTNERNDFSSRRSRLLPMRV